MNAAKAVLRGKLTVINSYVRKKKKKPAKIFEKQLEFTLR